MGRQISERPTVLLGRDHIVYGEYECVPMAGGRTACAMSVGADPASPGLLTKGDVGLPNEDALLAIDHGDRVLAVVADAHFGWQASHDLVTAIAEAAGAIPGEPTQLERAIAELKPAGEPTGSSSTLLAVVYDRLARQGFGVSFGDSSLVLVGTEGARIVNVRGPQFVDPHVPESLKPEEGYALRFLTQPDQLILVFTDGIDQCHYRSPETSIGPRHLTRLHAEVGPDPESYARRLMEMALAGVDGNPGGQDNIALVVSVA